MTKPTKAQTLALHNAQMLVFAVADKVFSASPRNDVPFADCLKLAKGRGYRDQWGHFKPY